MISNMGLTYKDAGVDIQLGDDASEIMYNASKLTWKNRRGKIGAVDEEFPGFFSLRTVDFSNLPPGTVGGHNQDGVGTKIEVAERVGRHDTVAQDLFAMVCEDAAARGAEPIIVGTTLTMNRINVDVVRELAKGMILAASHAGVAVTNGELAELGNRIAGYGDYVYNWEGTVFWLANRERLLTYNRVEIGDAIVSFRENGFRSNGLSLVRRIFNSRYGSEWHKVDFGGMTFGEAVLTPSVIYTSLIVSLTGGVSAEPKCKISAFTHITGGGIPGKLGRVLSVTMKGARLTNLFTPPPIMLQCQADGGILLAEAYRTWNMGNGLLCITPEPERVIEVANLFGFEARIAGEIIDSPNIIIKPPQGLGCEMELSFAIG